MINSSMSDVAIVATIGQYIKHERLNQNRTQAKVAEAAGVNRWTLSQIENGEAISLTSLIAILRAIDRLNILDIFTVDNQPSPLELAKIDREKRLRASSNKSDKPKSSEW
ncbi:MAG: transcriptional regulator with XRE-family HTH domain [Flavobacteriales bacterium]|jgi:transcriptional regulator with XRE-family HTH domain